MSFAMSVFDDLKQKVIEYLSTDSSGHDYYHALRVFNLAMYIQSIEGGEAVVVGCAALTHDICRPWEKKTGKSHFGDEALQIISKILMQVSLSESNIKEILDVISLHDVYDWTERIENKSIELQIVQDADNLDAIGAIGIARTFAFGGAHNLDMYIPGEHLEFTKDFVEDPNHRTSTIAHFYEKLLKLKDNMNTKTGKEMAEGRHKVMKDFLNTFFAEWAGER